MSSRAGAWLCLLVVLGCDSSPPMLPVAQPRAQPAPVPPDPDAPALSLDQRLARAEGLVASGDRAGAYNLFREVVEALPEGDPRRAGAQAHLTRLAFLLGLPQSEGEGVLRAAPPVLDPAREAAVIAARGLFAEGEALARADKRQEALLKYQAVIKAITEKEAPDLYWLTWQKIEDLSPEGSGPSVDAERAEGAEDEEGSALASGLSPVVTTSERLRAAREAYMNGVSLMRTGSYGRAHEAFGLVISSVREGEDPQLLEAARRQIESLEIQHERDLESAVMKEVADMVPLR